MRAEYAMVDIEIDELNAELSRFGTQIGPIRTALASKVKDVGIVIHFGLTKGMKPNKSLEGRAPGRHSVAISSIANNTSNLVLRDTGTPGSKTSYTLPQLMRAFPFETAYIRSQLRIEMLAADMPPALAWMGALCLMHGPCGEFTAWTIWYIKKMVTITPLRYQMSIINMHKLVMSGKRDLDIDGVRAFNDAFTLNLPVIADYNGQALAFANTCQEVMNKPWGLIVNEARAINGMAMLPVLAAPEVQLAQAQTQ
jgi:hypothetical protein